MTDQQHPITPPPELVHYWSRFQGDTDPEALWFRIANEAAPWGADQELEACCDWLRHEYGYGEELAHHLRSARRPKPPGLKKQALEDLDQIDGHAVDQLSAYVIHDDLKQRVSNIRRALEALPDD